MPDALASRPARGAIVERGSTGDEQMIRPPRIRRTAGEQLRVRIERLGASACAKQNRLLSPASGRVLTLYDIDVDAATLTRARHR